jgi:hypothetical protein
MQNRSIRDCYAQHPRFKVISFYKYSISELQVPVQGRFKENLRVQINGGLFLKKGKGGDE